MKNPHRLTLMGIATLSLTSLFTACTPATTDPSAQPKITVDGLDIKPGQKWEIKAWGGDGWNETKVVTVGSRYGSANTYVNLDGPDMTVQFFPANPGIGYPVSLLSFNWVSTFTQTANQTVFCALRDFKNPSNGAQSFEGRWIASMSRWDGYWKSGDTTGTGGCKITLLN